MSGDAYVDILNIMAVETSFQRMTTVTVSTCLLTYFAQAKSIYFRSGKSEADDSFEVYHINRLKTIDRRCLPEACKRSTCSSILCQRIHSPEPDKIGF